MIPKILQWWTHQRMPCFTAPARSLVNLTFLAWATDFWVIAHQKRKSAINPNTTAVIDNNIIWSFYMKMNCQLRNIFNTSKERRDYTLLNGFSQSVAFMSKGPIFGGSSLARAATLSTGTLP